MHGIFLGWDAGSLDNGPYPKTKEEMKLPNMNAKNIFVTRHEHESVRTLLLVVLQWISSPEHREEIEGTIRKSLENFSAEIEKKGEK